MSKRRPIIYSAVVVVLLAFAGGAMLLRRDWFGGPKTSPTVVSSAAPSSSTDPRQVQLGELCSQVGGGLWKRVVLTEPSRWLGLGRCPDPPPRARAVWESQPEYGRYFDRCLADKNPVVECVADMSPLCASGVLDDRMLERWRRFRSVLSLASGKGSWQVEDVEVRTSSTSAMWGSLIWQWSTAVAGAIVKVCLREGGFEFSGADNSGAPAGNMNLERTINVDTSASDVPQWDCAGTKVYLHGPDAAELLASRGCTALEAVPRRGKAAVQLSSEAECKKVRSLLESRDAALSCRENSAWLSYRGGSTPLRPFWWFAVANR